MIELAERGAAPATDRSPDAAGEGQLRLAAALDERNRQIAELAAQSRSAPISQDGPSVARSMVAAARGITGDPTWTLVVMQSIDEATMPTGAYGSEGEPAAIGQVHAWATTLEAVEGDAPGVRHAEGPWGAFVVVEVASSEELRADLLAPWEGRRTPSRAERELLGLLGQHAGMAIEHALLYAQVRRQADELNRMAALQADFLRGISHDLQTPLTSIRAIAEEMRAGDAVDARAAGDLDAIAHQADRLRRMVGQLLAVSRLEAGALTPRSEPFRVDQLVNRAWDALRAERPFALETSGERHLAIGDPDRFEQVLWAIFDNAVKYSNAGSRISAQIEPIDGPRLSVSITDQGRGMAPETLASAFDQFFRSADARELVPDGSGIGLYAAAGLMRAMGGTIGATSQLGAGTRMTLTIPAEPAPLEGEA